MANAYLLNWGDDVPTLSEWVRKLAPQKPLLAFQDILGVRLCGMMRLPDGPVEAADTLLDLHPADHPEFFPLFADEADTRYGYWMEEPRQSPGFVVEQLPTSPGKYRTVARNLFELLRLRLEERVDFLGNTETLAGFREKLMLFATEQRYEMGGEYLELYQQRAESVRLRLCNAESPEGMGLMLQLGSFRQEAVQKPLIHLSNEDLATFIRTALSEDQPGTALWMLKQRWANFMSSPEGRELIMASYNAKGRQLLAERVPLIADLK